MHRTSKTVGGAALALLVLGGACGSTEDSKAAGTTTKASATPASTGAAKELKITGVDYDYDGVPKKVAAGTVVSFTNASTKEVHEVAVLRVKDGETRPLATLLALPEAEQETAAEFRGIAIALPGKPTVTPRGPVTLDQPGRYILLCNIPTGADPAAYEEAMKKPGPPPSIPGGPPHFKKGMVAELTVG